MADSTPTASKPAASKSATPKPKPRAGVQRKTKAEREQFAKEEAERQKSRAAEEAKNAATRGGRGGRAGRGGRGASAVGQNERARDPPFSGGGVFGAGGGARPAARPRALSEGYAELLEGQQAARPDESSAGRVDEAADDGPSTSGGGRAGGVKKVEVVDIPSDDEPDVPKRNIERIGYPSDDDAEITDSKVKIKGKQKATTILVDRTRPGWQLRPTIPEHDPGEGDGNKTKKKGASQGKKASVIKKSDPDANAPGVEADENNPDAMDLDEPVFVKEQPSSPETRRRSLKKQIRSKDVKPGAAAATETIEELAERQRVVDDENKLRDVIVSAATKSTSPSAEAEKEYDSQEELIDPIVKKGKMFLFQLPPLTPFLVDPASVPEEDPDVKTEPGVVTVDNDHGAEKDGAAAAQPRRPRLQVDGLLTATEPHPLPSGLVGKLRLHKSGKVSLDWGGTDMEVRYGSEVSFLQDVVLVQPPIDEDTEMNGGGNDGEEKGKEKAVKPKVQGTAYALGPVRKKMVMIPDWAKLYD